MVQTLYIGNTKRTASIALLLFLVVGVYSQAPVVSNLSCGYRINPVGIGSLRPMFSWIIESGKRNQMQSAYRIIVSRSDKAIKKGKGDIWDSGKIASGESIQVGYGGPALETGEKYYWRVQIWDNLGRRSKWSRTAIWQMGLLSGSDWKNARWIAYDSLPEVKKIIPAAHGGGNSEWGKLEDILPLLRKEFLVKRPLKQATIFISGLGHFEMHLNGEKVGDHFLDPGWSLYSKHALYEGFDLTDLIKPGVNAIGVMLGNGFYHVPAERYRKITGSFGYPKMICRLILRYRDGSTEDIVSDSSWKAFPGPITFSSIFGGEDFDARRVQPGWNKAGFRDALWKNAVLVKGPPVLDATQTEPLKIMQTFDPVKRTQPKPGIFVYDLGQNSSGIPSLKVQGKSGDLIKITPGEILDDSGLVNQQPSGRPSYFVYTLNGKGEEQWQPRFTYYGFRYLQVEGGIPQGLANPNALPVIHEIKGLHTRLSVEPAGEFNCSNQLFNDIFKLIDWAIRSNLASVLTDCPHREKLGWLEVPHLLGNSVRYNYDIASFYRKIIEDMKQSQTVEGLVPNIAPEWVQFDHDFRDSPEWGSSSVILPYDLYKWYGDKKVLEESYEMMKRYVDYLGTKSVDHIVSHGLGDWFDIGPGGSGSGYSVSTPQGITGTSIYFYDLNILVKTATLLGKKNDAKKYAELAEQVKIAFNKKFFNSETKQYGTGSQTANAMAVYMQLVNPEDKEAVVANIIKNIRERDNRLSSGEVGYKYLIAVLEAEGYSDVIYDMNKTPDVPGYGYQIAHGATTLMEDWQAKKNLGNNHCMLGHLLGWFYSGLGGIRQADSSIAFREIIISPEPVGDVTSARVSYRSPYGRIVSDWKKDEGGFELFVEIPVNTRAAVCLPGQQQSVVYVNNKKINAVTNYDFADGKIKINTGSGQYRFVIKNK